MRIAAPLAATLAALALPSAARAGEDITVPVDVGVGPAVYWLTGPVANDQPLHFGLKISVQAIIDQATIQAHQDRIPARYRKLARSVKEVRYSPSLLIPDALIISPKVQNTGMYGVTWRWSPITLPIGEGPVSLRLSAGLLLTYAFLYSDVLPTTHFIRPGIDVGGELEIALSKSVLLGLGWLSGFYVPQNLGTFEVPTTYPFDNALWHFGQGFVKLHIRFPYSTRI